MTKAKVFVLGKSNSGKSSLINSLHKKPFSLPTKATVGLNSSSHMLEDVELTFTEVGTYPSIPEGQALKPMREASLGVICVESIRVNGLNEANITEQLTLFRQYCPDAPVILVLTKSDTVAKIDLQCKIEELEGFDIFKEFQGYFVTSSQNNTGISNLKSEILNLCMETEKKKVVNPLWAEAIQRLETGLQRLDARKKILIKQEIIALTKKLSTSAGGAVTPEEKAKAFATYLEHCNSILNGKFAAALKSCIVFAATALAIVLAGILGYGIGFAMGLWTGPGAFFSGLSAGFAASCSAFGLGTAVAVSYSLFKPSKEMKSINTFIDEIKALNGASDEGELETSFVVV